MKRFILALLLVASSTAMAANDGLPKLTAEQEAYIRGYASGTWTLNVQFAPLTPYLCDYTWDGELWLDEIVAEYRWLLSLLPKREQKNLNPLMVRRALLLAWGCGYEYP